ncbi:hypothetical protein JCM11641_003161 [Rhodosporidiobolus odoratus]
MVVLQLTKLDTANDRVVLCPSFVFSLPTDWTEEDGDSLVTQIREAAERVVKKWPVLAALPTKSERGLWLLDIPNNVELAALGRPLFTLTTSAIDEPYHLAAGLSPPPPPFSSLPSCILPRPDYSLFRHPSRPATLEQHASASAPLLSIHITLTSDAVCIGVSVAHGAFDGTGLGMILKALDAELHGREWDVPPYNEGNPFTQALAKLSTESSPEPQAPATAPPLLWSSWTPKTWLSSLRFRLSAWWEKTWHQSETRWVFIRQEAVNKLVASTKKEVVQVTGGAEYVSSGDVLLAWLSKAFYSDDYSSTDSLNASAVYSARPLLAPLVPILTLYPHTAKFPYTLFHRPLPLNTLNSMSVAELSLLIRRALPLYRKLPAVQAMWTGTSSSPPLLPVRSWPGLVSFLLHHVFGIEHIHRLLFSNQTSCNLAGLSLPNPAAKSKADLPLHAYFMTAEGPKELDGVVVWQQTHEGITVKGTMRKRRWEGMERALRQLK